MISVMLSSKTIGPGFGERWNHLAVWALVKGYVQTLKFPSLFFPFRVDLGTSDYLGLDVLLNCLTQLSSE
jgi:hypothetical protein